MKVKYFSSTKALNLSDIFHGLSWFAAEYPANLRENLTEVFNSSYRSNPLVCYSLFANSLTRQALCDDEFFRDHVICYSHENIGDSLKSYGAINPLYSFFPVDYPVPQWRYVQDGNINTTILMLNTLLAIVHINLSSALGEYVSRAVIGPNNPQGIIAKPDGKFMLLAIVEAAPFHYHAAVSNADGTNYTDDYAAYHGFPILNGIRVCNFGADPVEVLYMPAV